MYLWQFNAMSEAYQERQIDNLSIQIQAAYYGAYWNSATKHKKSLRSVLNSLRVNNKNIKRKPIDKEAVSKQFNQMEELRKYGWSKQ